MKIAKQEYPTQKGATLIEVAIFLGLVAILLAIIFGNVGGGSKGGYPVPGADQYIQNVTNAENVIGQLGTTPPGTQTCEFLRTYLAAAQQGLSNMQTSGQALGGTALSAAQQRVDAIERYIETNCRTP